jgi:hypothetical protein
MDSVALPIELRLLQELVAINRELVAYMRHPAMDAARRVEIARALDVSLDGIEQQILQRGGHRAKSPVEKAASLVLRG